MNVQIDDIMKGDVITAQPHHSVEHVRGMLANNHIHAVPVVDGEGVPQGIVSSSDLAKDLKSGSPVSTLMTEKVYTVPRYEGVHIAARMMRNHRIHHLVVTHEQAVVGIVSSLDLLALVEDKRFIYKNPPSEKKGHSKRQ